MRSPLSNRLLAPIAGALAAVALTALTAAPQAGAATVYACVNRQTHTARIFTRLPVCRRHETRVAWNTQGPAGRNGATGKTGPAGRTGPPGKTGISGTNGTDGANGAAAGYSASQPASVEFTGKKEVIILTKALLAGSYIVSAKTVVSSTAATAGVRAAVVCELLDGGPGAVLDTSGWDTGLVEDSGSFIGETTLALDAAVTLKATTVVSLACSDQSPEATEPKVGASLSQIVAVETALNK
jgi:hypothetical protein